MSESNSEISYESDSNISTEEIEQDEIDDNKEDETATETTDIDKNDEEECIFEYVDDPNVDIKEMILVPDEERITSRKLTKYERVRILGTRAKQIGMGAKVMLKYEGEKSPEELARLEIENKSNLIIIKRVLPNNKYELWRLSELEIVN